MEKVNKSMKRWRISAEKYNLWEKKSQVEMLRKKLPKMKKSMNTIITKLGIAMEGVTELECLEICQ